MKPYIYVKRCEEISDSDAGIREAFLQYCKEMGRPLPTEFPEIVREDRNAKPHFKNIPDVHFNVSHSGEYWVCVLSDQEVGIDIQKVGEKDQTRLAKRFLHPLEQKYLAERPLQEFYRLWTYNESYVKYKGDGLAKGLSYFSVVDEDGNLGVPDVCQYEIPIAEGYYCIVTIGMEE